MDFYIKKARAGSCKHRLEKVNEDRLNLGNIPLKAHELFEYETATKQTDSDYKNKYKQWLRS